MADEASVKGGGSGLARSNVFLINSRHCSETFL